MKEKINLLIALIAFLLVTISLGCFKKSDQQTDPEATKTTEMKISPTFNWSTTKPVDLKIIGIPGALDNRKTLILHSEGKAVFKEFYNINQNLNRKFYVPALVNNLTLEYGTFVKNLEIKNGLVEHSFIPTLVDE